MSTLLLAAEPTRERTSFDAGWRFHKGDVTGGQTSEFDDSAWRPIDLPHDWSIEGPYSAENASGTGFLPGGIGWYRKRFRLPERARGRKASIEFDGIYRNSDVWINGAHLGHRPNGYVTIVYDLTPHLRYGDETNVLAVRVDHSVVADSRWYTGSGIYRHTWLTLTNPVHVAQWGAYVRTPVAGADEALVSVATRIQNETGSAAVVKLTTAVLDPAGREVRSASEESRIETGGEHTFSQQVPVSQPRLWSIENPSLYTVLSRVYAGSELVDEYRTPFGIRHLRFHPDKGFFLNGKPTKFKGVCVHHDLGALGAAFHESALERRLRRLKAIGVNAIRNAHNPMSAEMYDLCDRLGLLVMDEAFDEWSRGKRKWAEGWNVGTAGTRGYHEDFAEWADPDVRNMVLRSRNHPSIVMWSIGNEIDYPGDPFTHPRGRGGSKPNTPSANELPGIAQKLIGAVKELDLTRPITLASANIMSANATGLAEMLDVVGYNYQEQHYARDHRRFPDRVILGSENSRRPDAWRPVALNEYVTGQFLWTGVDYLGESGRFPHRGSNSGLLDYCGFKKPDAWFRQALWTDKPMVYAAAWGPGADESLMFEWRTRWGRRPLFEHWNWSGDSRQRIPVEVYTNCDSVQLLLNGTPLREKRVSDRLLPVLFWLVPNEAGVVEAVGRINGKIEARYELRTAGPAARIELASDKDTLRSGSPDLASIEVRVVDSKGVRVPDADQTIQFEVTGGGRLMAVDNPDPRDINPVQASERKAYRGRALAIVSAGREEGTLTLRAMADGLEPGEIRLSVAKPER